MPIPRHLTFLFLFSTTALCGQSADSLLTTTLTPEQMNEDWGHYKQMLEETHPGLFRYMTKSQYQAHIRRIESGINEDLSFYAFYQLLAELTGDIRCAHTTLFPRENVLSFIQNTTTLFPFFTYPIDDRIYILFNGTEDLQIKPGYELISINGRSVTEIKNRLRPFEFRDGNSKAVERRFLQGGMFNMYLYFFVEQAQVYETVFKDLDGELITLTRAGLPYKSINSNYISNPVNADMLAFYNKKNKPWEFEIVDDLPSTAKIRFLEFGGKGMGTEEKAQKAMRQFMDKAMKQMDKKNIQNLIVELRSNSGGWDIQGIELLSYLVNSDDNFQYYANQYAVTMESDYLAYSDLSPEDIARAAKYLTPIGDGTFQVNPESNITLLPQTPKQNRFRGNVYILFDEQCASSCSEFVAAARANNVGVSIGNEAGGAYEGGNGSTFIHYTLPNSGIHSSTPLVKYENAVTPVSEKGRGTIPDHVIVPNVEDLLSGRDPVVEFVSELIRNN